MALTPQPQDNIGEIECDNTGSPYDVVRTITFGVLDSDGKTTKTVTKTIHITANGMVNPIKPSDYSGAGLGCYKVDNVLVIIPPPPPPPPAGSCWLLARRLRVTSGSGAVCLRTGRGWLVGTRSLGG